MPDGHTFRSTLIEYDIDLELRVAELIIRDNNTRIDYCVHLPLDVLPVVRDAIDAMIGESPELFPHVKTMRVFG